MNIALEVEIADLESYLNSINQSNESDLSRETYELRDDLIELIDLKKEELLEYKKTLLLQQCDLQITEGNFDEIENDIVGSKYSIDFRYNNGCNGRRNIVIYDSVYIDCQLHYISFFAHPVYHSELPCKMFLNNIECTYKQLCKYSHGFTVPSDDIREAVDLNATVSDGDQCLTLIEDGDVWRKCKILYTDFENNSCVVELMKFLDDKSDKVFNVTLDKIVKYPDMTNDEGCDENEADVSSDGNIMFPQDAHSKFGDWEQHTRGIGMKLLLQMGYQKNGGLGKHNQGRLNPIEIKHENVSRKHRKEKIKHKEIKPTEPIRSSLENIKSALARNEGKLMQMRSKIEALEKSKQRNNACKILMASADKKMDALRHKISELDKVDKSLHKKLKSQKSDKPKKLNIF